MLSVTFDMGCLGKVLWMMVYIMLFLLESDEMIADLVDILFLIMFDVVF